MFRGKSLIKMQNKVDPVQIPVGYTAFNYAFSRILPKCCLNGVWRGVGVGVGGGGVVLLARLDLSRAYYLKKTKGICSNGSNIWVLSGSGTNGTVQQAHPRQSAKRIKR